MRIRTICAAVLALVAFEANAASFVIKNCSGAAISVFAYDGTDTLLLIPYNRDAIVIAHGQRGQVACDGIRCKLKVIYPSGFHANWADYVYSYDSCTRSASDAELQIFSNCIC